MYKKTILLFFFICCFSACKKADENIDNKSLVVASFREVEGWNNENFEDFLPVFTENCKKIMSLYKNPTSSMVEIKLSSYKKICVNFFNHKYFSKQSLRSFLENSFDVYKINDRNDGVFTSYYAPVFNASLTKKDDFSYPILAKPTDAFVINLQDFDSSLPAKKLLGKIQDGKVVPYGERKDIVSQKDIPALLWLKRFSDVVDLQTQGSGIAQLDDNQLLGVTYDISNNQAFKGMGKILIEKKLIKSNQATSLHVKQWINKNQKQAENLFNENKRFVFHKINSVKDIAGAFEIPLFAKRSMAVDRNFIPLGSLLWLDTKGPDGEVIQKLVFAHDTGADIVGKTRGDLFWGLGDDTVLEKAGKMKSKGFYYILLPKNILEIHK